MRIFRETKKKIVVVLRPTYERDFFFHEWGGVARAWQAARHYVDQVRTVKREIRHEN